MLVEGAKIYIYDPKVPEEAIYSEVEYFMDVYGISVASVKKRSSQGAQNALLDFIRANIVVVRTAMDAVDNASAVLVLTEWDEFKTVNYEEVHQRMLKPACLLDGRLILDHERLAEIGFEVFAVGKCTGCSRGCRRKVPGGRHRTVAGRPQLHPMLEKLAPLPFFFSIFHFILSFVLQNNYTL
eukprot:gene3353-biopygen2111